jgi:hypothetical protein
VRVSGKHTLTLHQADQARTDFALIEDQLEFIMGQLARVPTRAYLCRTLLLATASVWALLGVIALLLFTALICCVVPPSAAAASEHRSRAVAREFQREHPCPSTGLPSGPCPSYRKDHVVPLACGGPDAVSNVQWQTIPEAKAKDKWELQACGR